MKKLGEKASFFTGKVCRLLKKIMKGMERRKEIYSFIPVASKIFNKNLLASYRIFTSPNKFFEIIFKEATTFNPLYGAEVGECYGWRVIVFLGKNYKAKRINSIIQTEIKNRKVGLRVEELFRKIVQNLIDNDKETGLIIHSIRKGDPKEDRDWKIDFILGTNHGDVPLQIKSSFTGQTQHKINDHNVPSLIFMKDMDVCGLKSKILLICKSYAMKIVEHL